jgi:hypothetical protein
MAFPWLKKLLDGSDRANRPRAARRRYLPACEQLETRLVPVTAVTSLAAGLTPDDLAQELVGGNVKVSNATFTGAAVAGGLFSGGNNTIGFDTGVVLSSGNIATVIGPNNATGAGTNLGQPGDPDLNAIIAPTVTFDAAVLEFDFVPTGSVISFQYVFGSEEYNEFVGSFNDVFAFFLDGVNVSLIPGTSTPVSINNVNLAVNSQFYINNATAADPSPAPPPLRNIQLDGLTTILTVTLPVSPGESHHIKLAVADASDAILDTAVFIRSGSLASTQIHTFRPLRYVYDAGSDSYGGNITISNPTPRTVSGPLFIFIKNLPEGVVLRNPDGFNSKGEPFIRVPSLNLPAKDVIRIPVSFKNTKPTQISTFFIDFDVELTNILT